MLIFRADLHRGWVKTFFVFSKRKCGGEWKYISLLSVFGLNKSADQIYRRVQTMETTETLSPISSFPSMATTKYLWNKLIVNLNENIKCIWNVIQLWNKPNSHAMIVCSYTSLQILPHFRGIFHSCQYDPSGKTRPKHHFWYVGDTPKWNKKIEIPQCQCHLFLLKLYPPWSTLNSHNDHITFGWCVCVCVRFSLSFRCHNDGAQTCGARKGLGKLLMSERF